MALRLLIDALVALYYAITLFYTKASFFGEKMTYYDCGGFNL
jgi:hypothetical protein